MPSSKRIAVLGAPGQLGSDLMRAGQDAGLEMIAVGHDTVEIADRESVDAAISRIQADVVVNCAAFHQVDECERDPKLAFAVNALGALSVARATRRHGGRTVYVSTDYVFDGRKPFEAPIGRAGPADAYTEGEPALPVNVYGASKLAGELLVQQADPDALIVRVSGLFGQAGSRGKHGTNFVEQIVASARTGKDLEVVDDQYVTPTYTVDAARAILDLLSRDRTGVVHVANAGGCTWHAFASHCVSALGLAVRVHRISAADRSTIAARPANTALCTARLRSLVGRSMPEWTHAVTAYLREVGHLTA